jgi:hypothetical protein
MLGSTRLPVMTFGNWQLRVLLITPTLVRPVGQLAAAEDVEDDEDEEDDEEDDDEKPPKNEPSPGDATLAAPKQPASATAALNIISTARKLRIFFMATVLQPRIENNAG